MLLAGCFHDDLSWKELLDAQGNKLSEQERALQEQQARLDAEQQRLDELAGKYDGLKKSDTPFMLVMAKNPADTITKGVDFAALFRVNPSGVAVTKEMIALDCIARNQEGLSGEFHGRSGQAGLGLQRLCRLPPPVTRSGAHGHGGAGIHAGCL